MKEKTRRIGDWNELVDFVESINPNKETIVLTGWLNQLINGHTYIAELMFTTKDVEILRDKNVRKTKRVANKAATNTK
jgi:hypothetical protein